MRKTILFLFIFSTQIQSLVSAQSFYAQRRDRDLIINVGTGASKYYGELVNPNELGKVRMNINVGAEYFLTNRISARTEVTWFQLSGSDALANSDRRERNLSFFSNNIEMDIMGSLQLFPNQKKFYQRPGFNIYGFGGIGLLYFNPKTDYEGKAVALQPLQTEGVKYSRYQFVIPVGLGARVKVNPWMNIAVEGAYRETFTDYLDDVSLRDYPDPMTLSSELSVALSDRRKELDPNYDTDNIRRVRGNPEKGDSYFILTVKAQIYVPSNFGANRRLYTSKRKAYYKKGGMYKMKRSNRKRG